MNHECSLCLRGCGVPCFLTQHSPWAHAVPLVIRAISRFRSQGHLTGAMEWGQHDPQVPGGPGAAGPHGGWGRVPERASLVTGVLGRRSSRLCSSRNSEKPSKRSNGERQGLLWGLAEATKELEASGLPPARGEPRGTKHGATRACRRAPCVAACRPGAVLWGSAGGESRSRAGLPDSNGHGRVLGDQNLGHKHVVSGVQRAVRRGCPSKS